MTDFDTITNILDRIYPNEEERPYYSWISEGKLILEFPKSDGYYNTGFVFDKNGALLEIY